MPAASKPVALLFAGILAACATPQSGDMAAVSAFAFAPPAGCGMTRTESGGECLFETAEGRTRKINVVQRALRMPPLPSEAEKDPKQFWEAVVLSWEAGGSADVAPGTQIRRAESRIRDRRIGPPGAQACVQFVYDVTIRPADGSALAIDSEGVRCAIYDPAANVLEEFLFEYEETRAPSVPRAPRFAADAERVVRTLRFSAPAG